MDGMLSGFYHNGGLDGSPATPTRWGTRSYLSNEVAGRELKMLDYEGVPATEETFHGSMSSPTAITPSRGPVCAGRPREGIVDWLSGHTEQELGAGYFPLKKTLGVYNGKIFHGRYQP